MGFGGEGRERALSSQHVARVEAAARWVMASAGQFWMRPGDLAHLPPPPEAPMESNKCYSAA